MLMYKDTVAQRCLYTSTFTGSDVMHPLRRSAAVLPLYLHSQISPWSVTHYWFETLNFDAELERMRN